MLLRGVDYAIASLYLRLRSRFTRLIRSGSTIYRTTLRATRVLQHIDFYHGRVRNAIG
jgi:hypothetical protein